jgi:hypothetical protein
MASDLAERITTKSDAELLQILLRDAAQYRPEVVEIAAREARFRGLSLELTAQEAGAPAADDVVQPEPVAPPPGYVYYAAGRLVTCPHCSGKRFFQRRALLNTRAATFLDLDWLNADAFALTCVSCSRIEWFARIESRAEELPE